MKKQAFTLVELIVVVTILAILATIGFVSYSGYLTGVRDTNRVASLTAISDGLELYRTKNDLPLPDSSVEVQVEDDTIARQGYAGSNVLQTIEYSKAGKDPKDDQYYSYYLTDDKKHYQMMAFLEESDNLETRNYPAQPIQPHPNPLLRGEGIAQIEKNKAKKSNILLPSPIRRGVGGEVIFVGVTHAATDYSNRHVKVYGKRLGILTDSDNTPIQEISNIKTAGNLNMTGGTTDQYIFRMSDQVSVTATGSEVLALKNLQKTRGLQPSCLQLLKTNKAFANKDGVYTIGNAGGIYEVYCDMSSDSGGWTFATMLADEITMNLFDTGNTSKILSLNTDISSKGEIGNLWIDNQKKDILLQCFTGNLGLSNYQDPFIIYGYKKSDIGNLTKSTKQNTLFSQTALKAKWRNNDYILNTIYGASQENTTMYIRNLNPIKNVFSMYEGRTINIRDDALNPSPSYSATNAGTALSSTNYCVTAIR